MSISETYQRPKKFIRSSLTGHFCSGVTMSEPHMWPAKLWEILFLHPASILQDRRGRRNWGWGRLCTSTSDNWKDFRMSIATSIQIRSLSIWFVFEDFAALTHWVVSKSLLNLICRRHALRFCLTTNSLVKPTKNPFSMYGQAIRGPIVHVQRSHRSSS